ncbi:MAG TPA: hypothetical protein VF843_01485 [Streptosporangiaceae bacterium]
MTTTAPGDGMATALPRLAAAASFLAGLTTQDFARVGAALAGDARLRALLPAGTREWAGAEVVAGRFRSWFGDTDDFEPVDAALAEIGGRLGMRWRLRLRAARLGRGWFTVEQQVYADTDGGGRIVRLDLLCTGYRPEAGDD